MRARALQKLQKVSQEMSRHAGKEEAPDEKKDAALDQIRQDIRSGQQAKAGTKKKSDQSKTQTQLV